MDPTALLALLSRALDETRCQPGRDVQSLTVHYAERDGEIVAAAFLETKELRVSPEWIVAA